MAGKYFRNSNRRVLKAVSGYRMPLYYAVLVFRKNELGTCSPQVTAEKQKRSEFWREVCACAVRTVGIYYRSVSDLREQPSSGFRLVFRKNETTTNDKYVNYNVLTSVSSEW